MTAVTEAPTMQRRCRIEEVFTTSFIELLAMAPRNSIVRSLVLSLTCKMPPVDCSTYEGIKDWVECNCEKRPNRSSRNGAGILISVQFEDREYGRASYSVSRSATESFQLKSSELLEMAEEAVANGDKLDALIDSVAKAIRQRAWDECEPCMEDYGDYDYSDHDQSDTESKEVEFSKPDLKQRMVSFLREYQPQLLEQLT
jgi:hypothetical protein